MQEFIGRAAQLRNTSKENVTIVCFLNWASMSLIKAEDLRSQSQLVETLLNSGLAAEHIGVVLMPTFTYTKGQLWRLATKAMELLASGARRVLRGPNHEVHYGTTDDPVGALRGLMEKQQQYTHRSSITHQSQFVIAVSRSTNTSALCLQRPHTI